MNPSHDLGILSAAARHRLARLQSLIVALRAPTDAEEDRTVAYVTIEALNTWSGFCRSLYLSCARAAKTQKGNRISHAESSVRTDEDAIRFAMRRAKPKLAAVTRVRRRDEPTWHDPNVLLTVVGALGASNASQVAAGLSLVPDLFAHLPATRNFFAHRNASTAQAVRQVARAKRVSPRLRPADFLCTRVAGRPQSVLADWLDELRITIELVCE